MSGLKIRGKTWCSTCEQEQPSSFVSLSIEGTEKTVHGFCSICETPVQRKFQLQAATPSKEEQSHTIEKDNSAQLYSKEKSKTSTKTIVESPSLLLLLAVSSVCFVCTYFW